MTRQEIKQLAKNIATTLNETQSGTTEMQDIDIVRFITETLLSMAIVLRRNEYRSAVSSAEILSALLEQVKRELRTSTASS